MVVLLTAAHRRGGPARSPGGAPRGLRSQLRAAVVAGCSALVVLCSVVYVFAPAQASMQMSFHEVTAAPAYERDIAPDYRLISAATAERRRWTETVYGSIETRGVPVSDAVLEIAGLTRGNHAQAARIQIGGPGTYRSVVKLRPGRYRLTLTLRAGSRTRSVSLERRLKNRRSYDVSVVVRESGIVTLLPVTSY